MRIRTLIAGGTMFVVAAAQVHAQDVRVRTAPRAFSYSTDDEDRPVIGVGTASSGGKRDTLGLLVTSVTPGGPAEKAGVEEGARIAAINGVNLRLSATDAGEPDMTGVATRRLTREIRKVKAGDEVELRLWQNGAARTVRVKTIAADELRPERVSRADADDRAVLGLTLNPTGTRRDTLGIFVSRVHPEGPAEKAGLVEGDRIAAINGVDLRVAREDAGDEVLASSKHSRFTREMRGVKAGQPVELRVYSNGAVRTVRVTTGRNEDVYRTDRNGVWIGGFGEGGPMVFPRAPEPPMPPGAPRVRVYRDGWQMSELDAERWEDFGRRMAEVGARVGERMSRIGPEVEARVRGALDRANFEAYRWQQDDEDEIENENDEDETAAVEAERVARPAATPRAKRAARDLEAENRELSRRLRDAEARSAIGTARLTSGETYERVPGVVSASATGDRFTLTLPGLRLSAVSADLASYLGAGSERGLLVVEADARWPALRAGDVLLAIDGRPVTEGGRATISADLSRVESMTVLRGGKQQNVTVSR